MITQQELKELLHYNPDTGIFTWKVAKSFSININSIAGNIRNDGYVIIRINKKPYYAHRLAWLYIYGNFPKNHIDHINNNKQDNRIVNLRDVTRTQNMCNVKLPKHNNSGIKGVGFVKNRNKWRVRIAINNKEFTIGYFDNLELATLVAEEARIKYHGTYANNG